MRDFIRNRLKTLLNEGIDKVTQADYARVSAKVLNDIQAYGNDPYMNDPYEGDGIYEVKLWPKGTFEVRQTKRAADVGTFNTVHNRRYFYVKAYRGIEHPEFGDDPRTGTAYGKSPADDAATKVRVIFAKDILEFVKSNIAGEDAYTADDKGAAISKEKTPEKWQYKFDKYKKEKEAEKSGDELKGDEEKLKAFRQRQADAIARREKMLARRKGRGLKEVGGLMESMNLHVDDYQYEDELETVGDITHYARGQLFHQILNHEMTPEEIEVYKRDSRYGDAFTPDGGDYFEETGTINFYNYGYPKRLIPKILSFIKYILNEKDVTVGEVRTDREGETSEVMRIPIIKNESKHSNPPELNMSNNNARFIFDKILNLWGDVDYGISDLKVSDVLIRVDSALKQLPSMNIDSRTRQQGNTFSMRMDKDEIKRKLMAIREIAMWANQRGYQKLYLA